MSLEKNVELKPGNALELKDIPPGTSLHNVELIPGNGAKLARSAGSSVTLSAMTEIMLYLNYLQEKAEK